MLPCLPPARSPLPASTDVKLVADASLAYLKTNFNHLAQRAVTSPQQALRQQLYGQRNRAEQQAGVPFTTEFIELLKYAIRPFTYQKELDPAALKLSISGNTVTLEGYNYPYTPKGVPANQQLATIRNKGVCHEGVYHTGRAIAYGPGSPEDLVVRAIKVNDADYFSVPGSSHTIIGLNRERDDAEVLRALQQATPEHPTRLPSKMLYVDPSYGRVGYAEQTGPIAADPALQNYKLKGAWYRFFRDDQACSLTPDSDSQTLTLEPTTDGRGASSSRLPLGFAKSLFPNHPVFRDGLILFRFNNEGNEPIKMILEHIPDTRSQANHYENFHTDKLDKNHPLRILHETWKALTGQSSNETL
jgi:hypothetical protein